MTERSLSDIRVEICLSGVESAIEAERGGADRVELCENLREGGTTPSYGTIAVARDRVRIGLFVLVRPRPGDFTYSEQEIEVMLRDIEAARNLGADGVVVGVLTPEGDVDVERMRALVAAARPLEVTFHRAFDRVRDPFATLEQLAEIGVDRILTSGQETTAPLGVHEIRKLVERSADRVVILPGGGVGLENVAALLRESGAREVHVGSSTQESFASTAKSSGRAGLGPGGAATDERIVRTSAERVRAVVEAARRAFTVG